MGSEDAEDDAEDVLSDLRSPGCLKVQFPHVCIEFIALYIKA